jgi:hypothetical protein
MIWEGRGKEVILSLDRDNADECYGEPNVAA